jgi:hypothetical protein
MRWNTRWCERIHFAANSACGHGRIPSLKWKRPKVLEKSLLEGAIPQVGSFEFLAEGAKCRESHEENLLCPRK